MDVKTETLITEEVTTTEISTTESDTKENIIDDTKDNESTEQEEIVVHTGDDNSIKFIFLWFLVSVTSLIILYKTRKKK